MPGKPDVPVDFASLEILASLFEDLPPIGDTPADGQGFAGDAPPDTPDAPAGVGDEDVSAAEAPEGVPPVVDPPEDGPPDGIPPDAGAPSELPLDTAGAHALPEAADDEAAARSPLEHVELTLSVLAGGVGTFGVGNAPDPQVELPSLPTKAAAPAKGAFPLIDGELPDVTNGHGAPPDTNPGTGGELPIPEEVDIHIA